MCFICLDEVIVLGGVAVATAPWWKNAWRKLCGGLTK